MKEKSHFSCPFTIGFSFASYVGDALIIELQLMLHKTHKKQTVHMLHAIGLTDCFNLQILALFAMNTAAVFFIPFHSQFVLLETNTGR